MVTIKIIIVLTILTIATAYTDLSSLYGPWIAVKMFGMTDEKSIKENKCAKLKIKNSSLDCPCGNFSMTVFSLKLTPGTLDKSNTVVEEDMAAFPVDSFEEAKEVGKVVLDDPECGCDLSKSAFQSLNDDYFILYFLPIKRFPMGFVFARTLPTYNELEAVSNSLVGVGWGNGKILCYQNYH